MYRLIKNTLVILITTCLLFATYGFAKSQRGEGDMYIEIGEFTFYCVEITRQPIAEKVGGFDEPSGIYWSGIDVHYGYAYMQTKDEQYGFYIPITSAGRAPYTIDDFKPVEAMALQDSDGAIYYIPTGCDPKDYQGIVSATRYYSELPKDDKISKAAPHLQRGE